jgi:hypothetical protein
VTEKANSKLPVWIACLIPPLFAIAATAVGAAIGGGIAKGIWELANLNHAPENAAGGLWGLLLGVPIGGIVGLIVATVVIVRWPDNPSSP